MDINDAMALARNQTQIIRARKNLLYTFGATRLPYICISEDSTTPGDINIRTGEVRADKPQISIPGQESSFVGFELEENDDTDMIPIMLARRVDMPTANYVNTAGEERCERGPLEAAVERSVNKLDQANDIRTAVIQAPDSVWKLSLLLYIGTQVVRSASSNINEHMERLFRQGGIDPRG